jgi:N-acetylneuraminate synthase/N,N'-diacetyllegionaminate synthase
MTDQLRIGGRGVGEGHPVFVIAEAGVNHNGDVAIGRALIDAAAASGADAVKFQTFSADRLVTAASPKAAYQNQTTDPGESQHTMLKRLELSAGAHRALLEHARARDIVFLSTPFDAESADLLETLGVSVFKLGSGELTDLPLLAHVARKGRPMIVSTGMSWMEEVDRAVRAIRAAADVPLALLHCVSNYPAASRDCNLRAMDAMRDAFRAPIGYSDHTRGLVAAIAAVARGACIIEKHLTLDRNLPGPDHQASCDPPELAALVRAIREAEAALGDGVKRPAESELSTREVARKSVVALVDIPRGQPVTREMLGVRRPGTGIPPADLDRLVGRAHREDIRAGSMLTWETAI